MNNKSYLLIVSGLSGAGKGTICSRLIEKYPDEFALSISATSRKPRGNEQDGVEYFFKTKKDFEEMISRDELLEYTNYVGNYYGTPKTWVEEKLKSGVNVVLEIDIEGGFQVSRLMDNSILIFIIPPDADELVRRLEKRGTESSEQIKKRLSRAVEELKLAEGYEYIITNDDVEKSVELLHNIVQSK